MFRMNGKTMTISHWIIGCGIYDVFHFIYSLIQRLDDLFAWQHYIYRIYWLGNSYHHRYVAIFGPSIRPPKQQQQQPNFHSNCHYSLILPLLLLLLLLSLPPAVVIVLWQKGDKPTAKGSYCNTTQTAIVHARQTHQMCFLEFISMIIEDFSEMYTILPGERRKKNIVCPLICFNYVFVLVSYTG